MTLNRNGIIARWLTYCWGLGIRPNSLCTLFWWCIAPILIWGMGIITGLGLLFTWGYLTVIGWAVMRWLYIILVWVVGVVALSYWLTSRYVEVPIPASVREVSAVLWGYLRAKKRRLCPLIDWKD